MKCPLINVFFKNSRTGKTNVHCVCCVHYGFVDFCFFKKVLTYLHLNKYRAKAFVYSTEKRALFMLDEMIEKIFHFSFRATFYISTYTIL